MNNDKAQKKMYLSIMPTMFFLVWLKNMVPLSEDKIVLSVVSFPLVVWITFVFYCVYDLIERSGVVWHEIHYVIKVKILSSFIIIALFFLVGLTLNGMYATFFNMFGLALSLIVFSLVFRKKASANFSVLYKIASNIFTKSIVDFLVGKLSIDAGSDNLIRNDDSSNIANPSSGFPMMPQTQHIHGKIYDSPDSGFIDSKWEEISPTNGAPLASRGYDVYGNMNGTFDTIGSNSADHSYSDLNR